MINYKKTTYLQGVYKQSLKLSKWSNYYLFQVYY
jgi:hypothetical protein